MFDIFFQDLWHISSASYIQLYLGQKQVSVYLDSENFFEAPLTVKSNMGFITVMCPPEADLLI